MGMILWLLSARGMSVSLLPLKKGQAHDLIDKLLSNASDDKVIDLLIADNISIMSRHKLSKSWQELIAKDIFKQSVKSFRKDE